MGHCFSKSDETIDEDIDEAPSEAINPILNDPSVNYVALFISGKSLIKPLHLSSNTWIMCEGSLSEMLSELYKLEKFDLVLLYVLENKPSMGMSVCVDLLRSTYTLANVWRAFFKNNGWGRNGEKGDKKIVKNGFSTIFLIRAEVEKLWKSGLENYNEVSKVINDWHKDIFEATRELEDRYEE